MTKHFDNVVTTARMPMQLDGDLDVDLDMDVASFRLRQRLKLNNRNGAEELEDPGDRRSSEQAQCDAAMPESLQRLMMQIFFESAKNCA